MYSIKCQGISHKAPSVKRFFEISDIRSVGVVSRKQVLSYCRIADMQKKSHICMVYRHLKESTDLTWNDIGSSLNHFGENLPDLAKKEWDIDCPPPQVGNGNLGRRSFEVRYGNAESLPLYFLEIEQKKENEYHLLLHWCRGDSELICRYPVHNDISCLNVSEFSTYLRYIGYDLAYNPPQLPSKVNHWVVPPRRCDRRASNE